MKTSPLTFLIVLLAGVLIGAGGVTLYDRLAPDNTGTSETATESKPAETQKDDDPPATAARAIGFVNTDFAVDMIGGYDRGYLAPDSAQRLAKEGDEFSLYSAGKGTLGKMRISKIEPASEPGLPHDSVLTGEVVGEDTRGSSGDEDFQKLDDVYAVYPYADRPPFAYRSLDTTSLTRDEALMTPITAFLRGQGVRDLKVGSLTIHQALRVERGEETEWILIGLTSAPDYRRVPFSEGGSAGHFSFLLLIRPGESILALGKELLSEKTGPNATLYWVSSLYDLNGDGTLEIITRQRFYEGDGFTIYEFADNEQTELKKVSELMFGL